MATTQPHAQLAAEVTEVLEVQVGQLHLDVAECDGPRMRIDRHTDSGKSSAWPQSSGMRKETVHVHA